MHRKVFICPVLWLAASSACFSARRSFDVRTADALWKIPRYPTSETWTGLPGGLNFSLARGERESGQVAVRAREAVAIRELRVALSPLRHSDGVSALPTSPEPVYMVAYVNPLDDGDAAWPNEPPTVDQPDPLRPVPQAVSLDAGETLTFWMTVTAPQNAVAGTYVGCLQVVWRGQGEPIRVPVRAHVWDFALPANTKVQTQLFSASLQQVAQYAHVEQDARSPRWTALIERCVDLYRRYRISPAKAELCGIGHHSEPVDGKVGRAYRFDGYVSSWRIDLPEELTLATEVTLMGWVKPDPADRRQQLVWASWARGEGTILRYDGEKRRVVMDWRHREPRQGCQLVAPIDPGEWHHIAMVFSAARAQLLVDGVLAAERANAPKPKLMSHVFFGTYAYRNSQLYRGEVDEFRSFDRALTADEIRAQMSAGKSTGATVAESFEAEPDGYSPYTEEGAALLEAWWELWRSEGLHLGNLHAYGADKWSSTDFRTAEAFFDRFYPWLDARGYLPYTYTRLPADETVLPSIRCDVNIGYGRWLGEHYPKLNRHQTFGDHAQDKHLDRLRAFIDVVDIWDITPRLTLDFALRTQAYLEERQRLGDRVSWYFNRVGPISRKGEAIQPLGQRGFFWQMARHGVSMVNHWGINVWDPPSGKHSRKDLQWFGEERCYRLRRTTGAGVASATFWWPSEAGPLPSIRWTAIRDGIEDYDTLWLISEGAKRAVKQGIEIPELGEALEVTKNVRLGWVGLYGVSTDFGGPDAFRQARARMGRVAERLQKAGLLPASGRRPDPPLTRPWRWLVDMKE